MKKFFLVVLMLILSGCATPFIETSTMIYHGPDHLMRGPVIVLPMGENQENSLEFQSVKNYLEKKLIEHGYVVAENVQPQYFAFITYGIGDGVTTVSTIPRYGLTGGGTSHSTGTISSSGGISTYSGTTTAMPTYGVVGSQTRSRTEYEREVRIDIWMNDQQPRKVYEMRGVSPGSCGNLNSVLFAVIDGMFEAFPGESGKAVKTRVEWHGDC